MPGSISPFCVYSDIGLIWNIVQKSFLSSANTVAASARPARWGLAAKLFAILTLLGATAVLVTGVLGYLRARDALEASIYDQLTTGRKSKARQVETYFRTIRNELSQLATAKMTIDAAREFRAGFDELERSDVPFEVRRKVGDWYEMDFLREMRPVLGKELNINDYLPQGPAAYYLQYHYIVANPYPKAQRKLVDDPGTAAPIAASTPSTTRSCAAPPPPSASST